MQCYTNIHADKVNDIFSRGFMIWNHFEEPLPVVGSVETFHSQFVWSLASPPANYFVLKTCMNGRLRVAHAPVMTGTFSRHRLHREPLVSDPGMHGGTCVTHVPWCTSRSLTRSCRENVPGIPGACATRNFYITGKWPKFDVMTHSYTFLTPCLFDRRVVVVTCVCPSVRLFPSSLLTR